MSNNHEDTYGENAPDMSGAFSASQFTRDDWTLYSGIEDDECRGSYTSPQRKVTKSSDKSPQDPRDIYGCWSGL